MAYEVNDKTGELVPYHAQSPDLFERFERLDEEQIVASLQGAAIEEYVYSFKIGGKETVGLSWVGAREAARHQGRIHISEPTVTEDADAYTVRCSAHDVERDFLVWAVARQEKNAYGKSDPFALNKAFSKAQRNAILSVIPTTIIVKTIAAYRERGQVRHVRADLGPVQARVIESTQPTQPVQQLDKPASARPNTYVEQPAQGQPVEFNDPKDALEGDVIPPGVRRQGDEAVDAYVQIRKSLRGAETVEALADEWKAAQAYLRGLNLAGSVLMESGAVKDARKVALQTKSV